METSQIRNSGKFDHLWWLILPGILGVILYFAKLNAVFPAASIDLKCPKATIAERSRSWAQYLGFNTRDTKISTVFSYDENVKTFLEYEYGADKANRLMRERLPVWYWSTRICRSQKYEELTVDLSPSGRILSFNNLIKDDSKLPTIPHGQARALAEKFLKEKAGISTVSLTLIEDGSVHKTNRIDHDFTWEEKSRSYRGAHLRTTVQIAGNKITAFSHYLHIPEKWERKFSKLRSYNESLGNVASVFSVILSTAIFFVFLWALRHGLMRLKFAGQVAMLIALLEFLECMNNLPVVLHNYETTLTYKAFFLDSLLLSVHGAANQFIQTFILAGAAECIYRKFYPARVALEKLFTWRGSGCQELGRGLLAGYGLFGCHLGFVVLYYLLGRQIGFWSPLDVRDIASLSSYQPFFSALYIGSTASFSEELTYRILGFCLIRLPTRNFWLANIGQAAIWAFLHSSYPQEPPYVRGLELTLVGMLYGYCFKLFGIIPCIISHFLYDSILDVTPLLQSQLPYLRATACLVVGLPAALCARSVWSYLSLPKTSDEAELTNSSIAQKPASPISQEQTEATIWRYVPQNARARSWLIIITVIATVICFACNYPSVGGKASLNVARNQVQKIATSYLRSLGIDVTNYKTVVQAARGLDSMECQYHFEKAGFKRAEELAGKPGHPLIWLVRFFRPLDPDQYTVTLDQEGKPLSLGIVLAESTARPTVSKESARRGVEDYINHSHPEMLPFIFEDQYESKFPNRTEYHYQFKVQTYKVADAEFRISADTVGQISCNFDQAWDIPQTWYWEKYRQTSKDLIAQYLIYLLNGIVFLATIWWTVGVVRAGAVRWRPAVVVACAATAVTIPQILNDLPEFFADYTTDTPLASYFTEQTVGLLMDALTYLALLSLSAALAIASFRIISPKTSLMDIVRTSLYSNPQDGDRLKFQRNIWIDAIIIGYTAGIGGKALSVCLAALYAHLSPTVTLAPLSGLASLANVHSPFIDTFISAFFHGLTYLIGVGIAAGLYAKYCGGPRKLVVFILIAALVYPAGARYWQDYLLSSMGELITSLATWFFIIKLARKNVWAYFIAGFTGLIAESMRILAFHGQHLFRQDLLLLTAVMLTPLIACLYLAKLTCAKRN